MSYATEFPMSFKFINPSEPLKLESGGAMLDSTSVKLTCLWNALS
jgi:hypothetical protein